MADKNFQPEKIIPEPGLKELKLKIEQLEPVLEKKRTPEEKEEAVKQEIKDYLEELQTPSPMAPPLATRDEADEIKKFPPSQQVGALVSLVFEKGLEEAVSVAKELNNPAILDEFHDILADRYYKEIVERKIIKP